MGTVQKYVIVNVSLSFLLLSPDLRLDYRLLLAAEEKPFLQRLRGVEHGDTLLVCFVGSGVFLHRDGFSEYRGSNE